MRRSTTETPIWCPRRWRSSLAPVANETQPTDAGAVARRCGAQRTCGPRRCRNPHRVAARRNIGTVPGEKTDRARAAAHTHVRVACAASPSAGARVAITVRCKNPVQSLRFPSSRFPHHPRRPSRVPVSCLCQTTPPPPPTAPSSLSPSSSTSSDGSGRTASRCVLALRVCVRVREASFPP